MIHKRKRLFAPFAMMLGLAACDTPHMEFRGVAPVWVKVDGSTFVIRKKEDRVEAIRMNKEWPPTIERVFPKAEKAIEQATKCKMKEGSMRGDAAQMFAKVKCPKAQE